jgi:hypothetical protein
MHQQFFLHTSLHFPAAGSSFCPLSGGVLHINLRVVQFNSAVAVDSECQVQFHHSLSTLQTTHFTLHTADCTTFHLPFSLRTCAFGTLHATHSTGDMQQLLPVHRFARYPAAYCI